MAFDHVDIIIIAYDGYFISNNIIVNNIIMSPYNNNKLPYLMMVFFQHHDLES